MAISLNEEDFPALHISQINCYTNYTMQTRVECDMSI